MKKLLLSLAVVMMGLGMMAQTTFTKVTSASGLEAGANYIIVGYDEALGYCAMGYQKSNNRHAIQVSEDGGSITVTPGTDPQSQTDVFPLTLGGTTGAWTFFDEVKGGYLYAASSSANQLKTQTTNNSNGEWSITFDSEGNAVVTSMGSNTRNVMRFNENSANGTPLFSCYAETSTYGVKVAFYKEGGSTILPEPSNYPAWIYASHHMNNVVVQWEDATGGQLPTKYLVVASKGNITVPTDGVPVSNGPLAKNVAYGVEEVVFSGLEGGTTYHFAIFPYTNSGSNINYKTDGNYPMATEKTDDVEVLLSVDFAEDLNPFTAVNIEGEQVWTASSYNDKTYAYINGFSGGTNYENEDWLISPNIFANGCDFDEVCIAFDNAKNYSGDQLGVGISVEYDGVSDPRDFVWNDVTQYFDWSEGSFAWVSTESYFIVDDVYPSLYVAFLYTSTTTDGAAWEITNFNVYGVTYASVEENATASFKLYPNPASTSISIEAEGASEVQIMDMAGRMVMSVNVVEGVNSISVADLESGVYFVKMNGTVVKFVKR